MRVLRLELRHFRGFESARIEPAGHVVLMGHPGAGRSDVIEGLARALLPDSTRGRLPDDLDFYKRDTSKRAEVEVVLGALGPDLEQVFFDHLEVWDKEANEVIDELADPDLLDRNAHDLVVRLCYRAAWVESEDQAQHWVDFPKTSTPDADLIDRVGRVQREAIPFAMIPTDPRDPLSLGARAEFRRLVEGQSGEDFAPAVEGLLTAIEGAASDFTARGQMRAALEQLVEPLRTLLSLDGVAVADVFRFLPAGGSITSLLRSLAPSIDLQDGVGALPLTRQGSTISGLLGTAQTIATVAGREGIIAVDDFGDGLGATTAQHMAATLRRSASQVWLSTRQAGPAQAFQPHELIRLARDGSGGRSVHRLEAATTKAERLAARHIHLQLVPAATARAVVIVEGPHDREALQALATRMHDEEGAVLPAGVGVSLIDAGAADSSGGSSAIPRLARAAKALGFRTVAVIDWDRDATEAQAALDACLASADTVVRLPEGRAIELALLEGLSEDTVKGALNLLGQAFGAKLPNGGLDDLQGGELITAGRIALKSGGGLHAQFVQALGEAVYPPVARRLLETAVASAVDSTRTGQLQL